MESDEAFTQDISVCSVIRVRSLFHVNAIEKNFLGLSLPPLFTYDSNRITIENIYEVFIVKHVDAEPPGTTKLSEQ